MSHRWLNTRFWIDSFVSGLDPVEKLLFLYFLTNDATNIAGIYELPLRRAAADTGIDKEMIEKILPRFAGRIHYIRGWVYILNFTKHQSLENENVQKGIEQIMKDVPFKVKEDMREIDKKYKTEQGKLHLPGMEVEEHKDVANIGENQKENEQIQEVFDLYKKKIFPGARLTEIGKDKIRSRLRDNTTEKGVNRIDEIKQAIDNFSQNRWYMNNNARKGIKFFFRDEEQIAKWLQLETDMNKNKSVTI